MMGMDEQVRLVEYINFYNNDIHEDTPQRYLVNALQTFKRETGVTMTTLADKIGISTHSFYKLTNKTQGSRYRPSFEMFVLIVTGMNIGLEMAMQGLLMADYSS